MSKQNKHKVGALLLFNVSVCLHRQEQKFVFPKNVNLFSLPPSCRNSSCGIPGFFDHLCQSVSISFSIYHYLHTMSMCVWCVCWFVQVMEYPLQTEGREEYITLNNSAESWQQGKERLLSLKGIVGGQMYHAAFPQNPQTATFCSNKDDNESELRWMSERATFPALQSSRWSPACAVFVFWPLLQHELLLFT